MATSIFDNKEIIPDEEDLKEVLKENMDLWNQLIKYLEEEYGPIKAEWKFYSKKAGWSYKVSNKKRNLIFLIPNDEYFIATVNMSLKVSEILLDIDLPKDIKNIITKTKAYSEGKSILINIKNNEDIKNIKTILNIRDN
ncbi:MAG: DUF3788 domain-containing protein [Methanobacteriaceae archaeon]